MGQTTPEPRSAEHSDEVDPCAALENIEDIPLAEQVEVFQTIHDRLAERLNGAES